jgi:6-phosphogluconolactonase (cycloisomerase 2 family)
VCGHQDTPRVTVFRLDPATGQLAPTDHFAEVPAVVCVLFHR